MIDMTTIYYDDGMHVSKKVGTIISEGRVFIKFRTTDGDLIRIPVRRIVRIEEK